MTLISTFPTTTRLKNNIDDFISDDGEITSTNNNVDIILGMYDIFIGSCVFLPKWFNAEVELGHDTLVINEGFFVKTLKRIDKITPEDLQNIEILKKINWKFVDGSISFSKSNCLIKTGIHSDGQTESHKQFNGVVKTDSQNTASFYWMPNTGVEYGIFDTNSTNGVYNGQLSQLSRANINITYKQKPGMQNQSGDSAPIRQFQETVSNKQTHEMGVLNTTVYVVTNIEFLEGEIDMKLDSTFLDNGNLKGRKLIFKQNYANGLPDVGSVVCLNTDTNIINTDAPSDTNILLGVLLLKQNVVGESLAIVDVFIGGGLDDEDEPIAPQEYKLIGTRPPSSNEPFPQVGDSLHIFQGKGMIPKLNVGYPFERRYNNSVVIRPVVSRVVSDTEIYVTLEYDMSYFDKVNPLGDNINSTPTDKEHMENRILTIEHDGRVDSAILEGDIVCYNITTKKINVDAPNGTTNIIAGKLNVAQTNNYAEIELFVGGELALPQIYRVNASESNVYINNELYVLNGKLQKDATTGGWLLADKGFKSSSGNIVDISIDQDLVDFETLNSFWVEKPIDLGPDSGWFVVQNRDVYDNCMWNINTTDGTVRVGTDRVIDGTAVFMGVVVEHYPTRSPQAIKVDFLRSGKQFNMKPASSTDVPQAGDPLRIRFQGDATKATGYYVYEFPITDVSVIEAIGTSMIVAEAYNNLIDTTVFEQYIIDNPTITPPLDDTKTPVGVKARGTTDETTKIGTNFFLNGDNGNIISTTLDNDKTVILRKVTRLSSSNYLYELQYSTNTLTDSLATNVRFGWIYQGEEPWN